MIENILSRLSQYIGKASFSHGADKHAALQCIEELRTVIAHELPDLSELREYHAKAISNLKSYADDEGLRDSEVKHYTKRAEFHARMVELIDKTSAVKA